MINRIFIFLLLSMISLFSEELIKNGDFENLSVKKIAEFTFDGDVELFTTTTNYENGSKAVQIKCGDDLNKDRRKEGEVSQLVKVDFKKSRWYRFTFKGLPQSGLEVKRDDDLYIRVDFYSGTRYRDHVKRNLFDFVKKQRKDLDKNGVNFEYGSSVWRSYDYEFQLPFKEVDSIKISVGLKNGIGKKTPYNSFQMDDWSLIPIEKPALYKSLKIETAQAALNSYKLIPLGGHWYYKSSNPASEKIWEKNGLTRVFNYKDEHNLVYKTENEETPFVGNMRAWMQPGFLNDKGVVVDAKYMLNDTVLVQFSKTHMIMYAKNIPNHLTGKFPGYLGNPNYIKERQKKYLFPLNPKVNSKAVPMDDKNTNRALNMGAVGLAINGVVFYNPFDAGSMEAVNIMDRCCGHPNQHHQYHYHKYPVCVRSPFTDEGAAHSRLIGFAFDGFPVYGPYERDGTMAMDDKKNPLNKFNAHYDKIRGWHYHVTPGKFPYIIGGYFGYLERSNLTF